MDHSVWRMASRKTSRPILDMFDELSDISFEDSKMEALKSLKVSRRLTQAAPSQSRFLKRNQTLGEKHLMSEENAFLGSWPRMALGRPPPTASNIRASAALTKLAQIESRIMSRRNVLSSLSDTESDSKPTDDGLPESAGEPTPRATAGLSSPNIHRPFQKHAHEIPSTKSDTQTGKVSRFLKKKELPIENRPPSALVEKEKKFQAPRQKVPARKFDSPDSDEEEMKELLGSLMESSVEKEICMNQAGLVSAKIAEKEHVKPFLDQIPAQPSALSLPRAELSSSKPLRTSRLPAPSSAPGTPGDTGSRACSPQTQVSGNAAPHVASLSVPDTFSESLCSEMGRVKLTSSPSRSEARPLDEPDFEAADSLDDFRINILSLDDLTPASSEKSDLGQKEEGCQRERPQSDSSPPVEQKVRRRARPQGSWLPGRPALAGDHALLTESQASEHLSTSSGASLASTPSAGTPTGSLAYSEDFESSPGPTSGLVDPSRVSLDRSLATLSEFSSSLQTDLVPRPPPSRKWGRDMTRVLVKEMAVQTLDPAFAYHWTAAAGMAAVGPALGSTYVDPAPVASHVVSADAVEALTAYSPAALALNDMLKQQLSLTRQFIEASRHLHVSLLQSLEGDSFHYHTLEEAKEYIRSHRPTPLTLEKALQEVKEELRASSEA